MDTPPLQKLLDDIKAEIAAGNKITAIKLYRDASGAGLAEAKEAVELIAAGKPPKAEGRAPQPDDAALQGITAAISAGSLIEAIRLHRAATGVGLKEAKDAVDALAVQLNPAAGRPHSFAAGPILMKKSGKRGIRPLAPMLSVAIRSVSWPAT